MRVKVGERQPGCEAGWLIMQVGEVDELLATATEGLPSLTAKHLGRAFG